MYQDFEKLNEYFFKKVKEFGGNIDNNFVKRDTVSDYKKKDEGWSKAFFGCISEEEGSSGKYSDLSLVVFPSNEKDKKQDRWLISLCVGTDGYVKDYEIVSLPGTRRKFVKYLSKKNDVYIKHDFTNIENDSSVNKLYDGISTLKETCKDFKNFILAAQSFDPNNNKESKGVIDTFLALYADLRGWGNNDNKKNINEVLQKLIDNNGNNESEREKKLLKDLLKSNYVVLQGAPGTGKTRLAKLIARENKAKIIFTQFHAETSYSDFVYKIIPDVRNKALCYKPVDGILVKAISYAQEHKNEKVYLIIDEINRASLSNVLGPIFYLFEPGLQEEQEEQGKQGKQVKIEITPTLEISKLPENLYVIATMNTADRSLAVVDFALRRRFVWLQLNPRELDNNEIKELKKNKKVFCKKEFNEIDDIFKKYATDEELNLQPGHSYFIVGEDNKEENMKKRIKYELMPLIKEYLMSGFIARAKDDFVDFFRNETGEELFN